MDTLAGSAPPSTDNSVSTKYHVFINHRGPDVKKSLASVVYQFFEYLGLRAFLDSQELKVGGFLSAKIESAIQTCPIQIAIFSPNYAASPWCLAELHFMLKTGAKIVPVFYEVQPSDLRYADKGIYADAFVKYVEKGRYLDKLEEWKEALRRASFISGIEFKTDGDMGNLCKSIVDSVLAELKSAKEIFKLEVAEHPVGLEDPIKDILGSNYKNPYLNNYDIKGTIIPIVGVAGSGKTTLAKELYNRIHPSYNKSSFLCNVREAHANNTMAKLQDQLIYDLCLPLSTSALHRGGGEEMIRSQIANWYSKALVILDDVDSYDQLEAFAVSEFLKNGAMVIVTTRDIKFLAPGIGWQYFQMDPLAEKHARELLCWHAFAQTYPVNGCEKIVEDFVRTAGGLPSNIVTLGQHLSKMMGGRMKP